VEDLIEAAKRGLDVEVILDQCDGWNKKNTISNQETGVMLANGGVKVYLDPPHKTTHSKLIIIDGIYTVIGSTNWTYHGLEKNNESCALIESAHIARLFTDYFMRLRSQSPVMITPTGVLRIDSKGKE
jgi:cardiolipin synthase